jgi:hypothetical protein
MGEILFNQATEIEHFRRGFKYFESFKKIYKLNKSILEF